MHITIIHLLFSAWFKKQFELQHRILDGQEEIRLMMKKNMVASSSLSTGTAVAALPSLPVRSDEAFDELGNIINADQNSRQALVSYFFYLRIISESTGLSQKSVFKTLKITKAKCMRLSLLEMRCFN